jgi:hypothetical protein
MLARWSIHRLSHAADHLSGLRRTFRRLVGPAAFAGLACLIPLALTACGAEPRGSDPRGGDRQALPETPSNNSFTRGVNTMTGSIGRSRDAAAAAEQRSTQAAAAANAVQ